MKDITPSKRTKGFQHFTRGEEDEIGLRGEEIFSGFLKSVGVRCGLQEDRITWWKIMKHYTKQRYDFIINNKTIDVKTVDENPNKKCFLLPLFEEIKCDFYVGIKLPETICGYLSADEVRQLPINDFGHCEARWSF